MKRRMTNLFAFGGVEDMQSTIDWYNIFYL